RIPWILSLERRNGVDKIYLYNKVTHRLHIKGYCVSYDPRKAVPPDWLEVESEDFVRELAHQKYTKCKICQRKLEQELEKNLRKGKGK
ncbi:MAG: hypothetical protein K2N29_07270, partial [Ruminiclostridium sp.]|nr:hypothetical protein [Ruminiclostridium sp.]